MKTVLPVASGAEGNPTKSERIDSRFWLGALLLCVVLYILITLRFVFDLYDRYAMLAYDLGIFDQAVWLISRGQSPFVTVRGMHILADHFSVLLYLLAPLYWLWASPKMLLIAQTIALALGAVPVYALAYKQIGSSQLGFVMGVAYLLYPALQWTSIYEFHPENFAIPLLIGAFYFLACRRWAGYFCCIVVTALTKETAGLIIIALGLYAFTMDRRIGWRTLMLGVTSVLLATATVRHFNEGQPSAYLSLYATYGTTPQEIVWYLLTHPFAVGSSLFTLSNLRYLFELLQPLMFLPLLAPRVFAVATPVLLLNLLSKRAGMQMIYGQYAVFITPIAVVAAIYGVERLLRVCRPKAKVALSTLFCVSVIVGTAWSPIGADLSRFYGILPANQADALDALLVHIPANATVSAQSALLPHLSHRKHIYTFPNPFHRSAWGGSITALEEIDNGDRSLHTIEQVHRALAVAEIEYIALCPRSSPFPLSREDYEQYTLYVLQSPHYGIIVAEKHAILLRRGADHANGWRLFEQASGTQIASESDIPITVAQWVTAFPPVW